LPASFASSKCSNDRNSRVLATIFLAGAALGAPTEKSAKGIFLDVNRPLNTWRIVKLIDIDPSALVDGKIADDSIIYSYEPPINTESRSL
jgi:hypothetical protein